MGGTNGYTYYDHAISPITKTNDYECKFYFEQKTVPYTMRYYCYSNSCHDAITLIIVCSRAKHTHIA